MSRRKRVYYIIFAVLFVILLLSSTQIIVALTAENEKFKMDNLSNYQTNSNVFFAVGPIETYEDLKESLYITGWAFCETEDDNPEKTITAIWKGTDKIYSLSVEAAIRRDVRGAFPGKKLPSMRFGIEINASTLEMKDDVYELLLYVWENEKNYGLIRTGIKIEKSRNYFDIYQPHQISVSEQEIVEDEHVKYIVKAEASSESKSTLELSGWGFIENEDMQECDIYVVLLDEQGGRVFYETTMSNRLDVANHFQDDRYSLSGCAITIDDPQDLASASAYTVAVKKDGIYHISPEVTPLSQD